MKNYHKKSHLSLLEKDDNEFKRLTNKHSVEEVFIRRAVKMTNQILYDKGEFDGFPNAVKALREFLFVTRRRPDLEEVNDVLQ